MKNRYYTDYTIPCTETQPPRTRNAVALFIPPHLRDVDTPPPSEAVTWCYGHGLQLITREWASPADIPSDAPAVILTASSDSCDGPLVRVTRAFPHIPVLMLVRGTMVRARVHRVPLLVESGVWRLVPMKKCLYLAAAITQYETEGYRCAAAHAQELAKRLDLEFIPAHSAWRSTAEWLDRWPGFVKRVGTFCVFHPGGPLRMTPGVWAEVRDAIRLNIPIYIASASGVKGPYAIRLGCLHPVPGEPLPVAGYRLQRINKEAIINET